MMCASLTFLQFPAIQSIFRAPNGTFKAGTCDTPHPHPPVVPQGVPNINTTCGWVIKATWGEVDLEAEECRPSSANQ